jgi:hypothetical protein
VLLEIPAHENQRNNSGDKKTNEVVHANIFSFG